MWTHLFPYLGDEQTYDTIQRNARIGLWRAINLGRLVVLAGSGVTRACGQMSWRQIQEEFVRQSLHQVRQLGVEKSPQRITSTTAGLRSQILQLLGYEGKERDPDPDKIDLGKPELDSETLRTTIDLCEAMLLSHGPGRASLNAVRRSFAEKFRIREDVTQENRRIISDIFNATKSRRILTTNYDAEFEKSVFSDHILGMLDEESLQLIKPLISPVPKTENASIKSSLDQLIEKTKVNSFNVNDLRQGLQKLSDQLSATPPRTLPSPRRIEIQVSESHSVLSNSLNADNVGDLLNFASYSRSYNRQIFHLHGRFDRPKDMVVTQKDYRRVYTMEPRSEQAFQSAQEVLFAGNDVLMLGFGLTEEDVLRPFRRFVLRGRDAGQAPRRSFALMPTATGDDYHRKNTNEAVHHALNHEIYVLHYGGRSFRKLVEAINQFRKILNSYDDIKNEVIRLEMHENPTIGTKTSSNDEDREKISEDINKKIKNLTEYSEKTIKSANLYFTKEISLSIFEENISDIIKNLATHSRDSGSQWDTRTLLIKSHDFLEENREILNFSMFNPTDTDQNNVLKLRSPDFKSMVKRLDDIENIIRTRALRYELQQLDRLSRDWWDAWRHSPHERRARYHIVEKKTAGAGNYLKVRHHTIRPTSLEGTPESWPCLVEMRSILRELYATEHNGVLVDAAPRILRITAPRGGGRASIIDLMMHKKNQEYVFNLPDGTTFYGAFIAHLSFSMEFMSVIKALTRFFAAELAKAVDVNMPEQQLNFAKQYPHTLLEKPFSTQNLSHTTEVLELRYASLVSNIYNDITIVLEEYRDYLQQPKRQDGVVSDETSSSTRSKEKSKCEVKFEKIHKILSLQIKLRVFEKDHFIKPSFCVEEEWRNSWVDDVHFTDLASFYTDLTIETRDTKKDKWLNKDRIYMLARRIAAGSWEDDQQNIDRYVQADQPDPARETPREHRLDVLKRVMGLYGSYAPGRRVFVCLSGLDRVTDARGDAYNPAHRAFFRLLTDSDEVGGNEPLRTPMDLLLVAGRPESPICYLSQEVCSGTPPKAPNQPRAVPEGLQLGDLKNYSSLSRTGRHLRKWHQLKRFDWRTRARLIGVNLPQHAPGAPLSDEEELAEASFKAALGAADDTEKAYNRNPRKEDELPAKGSLPAPLRAAAIFIRWAETTDSSVAQRNLLQLHGSSRIHRLLREYNSLSLWVMTAWINQKTENERWPYSPNTDKRLDDLEETRKQRQESVIDHVKKVKDPLSDTHPTPMPNGFHSMLRDLDSAAARQGVQGVITYVLDQYKSFDKTRFTPQHDLVPDYVLNRMIMRQLVLFALPVEPWVLLGCPRIYEYLKRRYVRDVTRKLRDEEKDVQKTPELTQDTERDLYLALSDWHERWWMLRVLHKALAVLDERGLVMKVRPAADAKEPQRDTTTRSEPTHAEETPERFLHFRYSLHTLLRQNLSHRMQLSTHDDADLNHHRMSIFCDQPRDLPSPSREHFEMVNDVLANQVKRCRESLGIMYQFSRERDNISKLMQSWDHSDQDRTEAEEARHMDAAREMAERVYAPPSIDDRSSLLEHEAIKRLVDHFDEIGLELDPTEENPAGKWDNPNGYAGALGRIHAVPQRLRALLSLLQGAFSIGSLSRLDLNFSDVDGEKPFDAYRSWLRSLLNAGASLERTRWEVSGILEGRLHYEPTKEKTWIDEIDPMEASGTSLANMVEHEQKVRQATEALGFTQRQNSTYKTLRHPFYRDEIAWLYNERGLASLTQGSIFDAIPLFEQAAFVMSHRAVPHSDTHAFHAAERRIRLNLAIAMIERGNIDKARNMLTELEISTQHVERSTPSEINPFAKLYLGLCEHLSGGHLSARQTYEELIPNLAQENLLRAEAITMRLLADLLRSQGDLKGAKDQAGMAVRSASRANQRDIEHSALVSEARILIDLEDHTQAQSHIQRALNYTENMGLTAGHIDAKLVHALLMNVRGDYGLAGQYASEAIALSVKNGLRLRKLSGLMIFAETRVKRGSNNFAIRILREVIREAEIIGYLTLAGRANNLLATTLAAEEATP